MTPPRFVLLSGCSGGGKSTLLAALGARGFATVPEPGRRVIAAVRAGGAGALPWVDLAEFARAALALAAADLVRAASLAAPVFFDRGTVDAAAALAIAEGADPAMSFAGLPRYDTPVFLFPPWPELYATDADRPRAFAAAEAEYDQLAALYPALGYRTVAVPRRSVAERAAFVLDRVGH